MATAADGDPTRPSAAAPRDEAEVVDVLDVPAPRGNFPRRRRTQDGGREVEELLFDLRVGHRFRGGPFVVRHLTGQSSAVGEGNRDHSRILG